jgi:hypothetical protein
MLKVYCASAVHFHIFVGGHSGTMSHAQSLRSFEAAEVAEERQDCLTQITELTEKCRNL